MSDTKPYIIGVCGRSCSGKSTVVKRYESENQPFVTRICQDRFFKKFANNWEAPEALNNKNLIYSLKKLRAGEQTHIPSQGWTEIYDRLIYPSEVVIVEGYLLFYDFEIVKLLNKKIYIDVSDLNILYRRTKRDGTSKFIDYTMNTVIPESHKYIKKQKSVSDIILDGDKDFESLYKDFVSVLTA